MAVRLLAVRAHSRVELATKLARRGFDADQVEAALQRLGEHGYLDDAAYAASLVRRRARERGRAAIAAELGAKGVARELVGEALLDVDRDAQVEAARRLVSRWPGLDAQRVAARLQRRGFDGEVIGAVLGDVDVTRSE